MELNIPEFAMERAAKAGYKFNLTRYNEIELAPVEANSDRPLFMIEPNDPADLLDALRVMEGGEVIFGR